MARPSFGTSLAVAATIAVLAAVAVGLFLIETPDTERGRRIDARRVQDLDALAHAIDCHWTLQGTLPQDLEALDRQMTRLSGERPLDGRCMPVGLTDPETDQPYGYRIISDSAFELCTTFAEASPGRPPTAPSRRNAHEGDAVRSWTHDAGAQCFSLVATTISVEP